jgi:hypothetical protein
VSYTSTSPIRLHGVVLSFKKKQRNTFTFTYWSYSNRATVAEYYTGYQPIGSHVLNRLSACYHKPEMADLLLHEEWKHEQPQLLITEYSFRTN